MIDAVATFGLLEALALPGVRASLDDRRPVWLIDLDSDTILFMNAGAAGLMDQPADTGLNAVFDSGLARQIMGRMNGDGLEVLHLRSQAAPGPTPVKFERLADTRFPDAVWVRGLRPATRDSDMDLVWDTLLARINMEGARVLLIGERGRELEALGIDAPLKDHVLANIDPGDLSNSDNVGSLSLPYGADSFEGVAYPIQHRTGPAVLIVGDIYAQEVLDGPDFGSVAERNAAAFAETALEDMKGARFDFETDARGQVVHGSDLFKQITGYRGEESGSLEELMAGEDLSTQSRIAAALASQDTWTGIEVTLPLEESDTAAIARISGIPNFEPAGTLKGYRGFGAIERLVSSSVGQDEQDASVEGASSTDDDSGLAAIGAAGGASWLATMFSRVQSEPEEGADADDVQPIEATTDPGDTYSDQIPAQLVEFEDEEPDLLPVEGATQAADERLPTTVQPEEPALDELETKVGEAQDAHFLADQDAPIISVSPDIDTDYDLAPEVLGDPEPSHNIELVDEISAIDELNEESTDDALSVPEPSQSNETDHGSTDTAEVAGDQSDFLPDSEPRSQETEETFERDDPSFHQTSEASENVVRMFHGDETDTTKRVSRSLEPDERAALQSIASSIQTAFGADRPSDETEEDGSGDEGLNDPSSEHIRSLADDLPNGILPEEVAGAFEEESAGPLDLDTDQQGTLDDDGIDFLDDDAPPADAFDESTAEQENDPFYRELGAFRRADREEPQEVRAVRSDLDDDFTPISNRKLFARIISENISPEEQAALLDRLPLGLMIFRADDLIFANRAFLELLGFADIQQLAAMGGLNAIFDGDELDNDSQGGGPGSPLRAKRASGDMVDVIARLQAIPWGGQTAMLLSVREVPPATLELHSDLLDGQQSDRLDEMNAILDIASDGVVVIDSDGTIERMNAGAEALFGFTTEEKTGAPFTSLFTPSTRDEAAVYVEDLAQYGVASVLNDGREVRASVKQGGEIPVFLTVGRVISGPDGKFCAVLRDISPWKSTETELVHARKRAEDANAHKSDFLAKISHEIRTPLNAIIGFSEVMNEERFGPIGNARYRDYVQDIHAGGRHLLSLINDLLDLSKVEAGKMDMAFTSVNLNELVQETATIMQPDANRERIIVRTNLPSNVPPIVADARSLKQILLNVLSNGVKFTQPGGQVIASTRLDDSGEVTLSIRDTGIGMSDDDMETALEPFRQIATSKKTGAGTGLGLPLTKALVEANRANFSISSALDEGTTVRITFPVTRVLAE